MTMTKIERVRAALSGAEVDRPPFSVWYHFGLQHAPAERTAQVHLEFFEAYNLDWLKVMNDYSYPMPRSIETLTDPRDLKRDHRRSTSAGAARGAAGGDPPDRPVAPGQGAGRGHGLQRVEHAEAQRRQGGDGAAHAGAPGGARGRAGGGQRQPDPLRDREPPRRRVRHLLLGAGHAGVPDGRAVRAVHAPVRHRRSSRPIRPFGEFHVLHAHGKELYLDRLQDYPVHAISWADREGGPPLTD